jgi:hypothetical protein
MRNPLVKIPVGDYAFINLDVPTLPRVCADKLQNIRSACTACWYFTSKAEAKESIR